LDEIAGGFIFIGMIKLRDILFEAKQVGVIYHYTTIDNLFSIMKRNYLSSGKFEDDNSISFTRDKLFANTPRTNIGTDVRLVIDGNKLSSKYKIEPYQFTGSVKTNIDFGEFDFPSMTWVGDEQEERLYLPKNKSVLDNVKDSIIKIEFPKKWDSLKFVLSKITPFETQYDGGKKLYMGLNSILKQCLKKGAFEEDEYIKTHRPAADWWQVGKWTKKDIARLAWHDSIFDQSKIDKYRPDMEKTLTDYFQKPVTFTMET